MLETTNPPNLSFLLQTYKKKDQQKENFSNTPKVLVSDCFIAIAFWCLIISLSIVIF